MNLCLISLDRSTITASSDWSNIYNTQYISISYINISIYQFINQYINISIMNLCLVSLDRSTITSKVITASSDWSNIYMIHLGSILRLVQYIGPILVQYWSNIGPILVQFMIPWIHLYPNFVFNQNPHNLKSKTITCWSQVIAHFNSITLQMILLIMLILI